MNMVQSRLSLPELRGKTDRDLVVLVAREIERSQKLARQGAVAEAEAIYLQAKVLLGIARAPDPQRSEMEARLDQTRAAIECRRSAPRAYTQSASC
jgi:hypothetical protein